MTSNCVLLSGQLLLFSQINRECKFGGNRPWYSGTWSTEFGGGNSVVTCGRNVEGGCDLQRVCLLANEWKIKRMLFRET